MKDFFDVHSHYMPGVDDGAVSEQMTLQMLEMAFQEGIRRIVLTPHYRKPYFMPEMDLLREGHWKVIRLARTVDPKIKIYLGNEVHYHKDMLQWLKKGTVLTMAKSSYVLTEFSTNDSYEMIHRAIQELTAEGYRPIVAHVERCAALNGRFANIEQLIDAGAYIQVNAGTFSGEYGYRSKKFVCQLVKQKLIDFVGTDAHNISDRCPNMTKCANYLKRTHGEEYMERILHYNPKHMVMNMEL